MSRGEAKTPRSLGLRAGEWVEVRSRDEILATLDENGALDGLPFMPEMLASCGQSFRVYKRAHKTCDTIRRTGGRRMRDAVHLEGVRCDGSAHGGCQAACLIFWKEAWLRRAEPVPAPSRRVRFRSGRGSVAAAGCSEDAVHAAARLEPDPADGAERWACQATRLLEATEPLAWWNPLQYVEDVTSGNARVREIVSGLAFRAFTRLLDVKGYRLLLWGYDRFQRLVGGRPYPMIRGSLDRTPRVDHGIRPGAMVRVRSLDEIVATLDQDNRNRGLWFDAEMGLHCGSTHRVAGEVERILDERSGRMIRLRDCLVLEGVTCRSMRSDRRIGCPRAILHYWRQSWLEPVSAPDSPPTSQDPVD